MVDMSNRGQSYVKEGEEMHNIKRRVAKGVVKMLDKVLRIEANTSSSACSAIWMTRLRNTMHLPKRLLLKPKMGSTHLCHLPLL
jgi:hypothetical protein